MSYSMDQPILFYYFAPLVSFWFLTIYLMMSLWQKANSSDLKILLKSGFLLILVYLFVFQPPVLEWFFLVIQTLFGTLPWDIREARFRLGLDILSPFLGMFVAWINLKLSSKKEWLAAQDYLPLVSNASGFVHTSLSWKTVKHIGIISSLAGFFLFFWVDYTIPSKFMYNQMHYWISMFPIIGFVILRNATATLRRYCSTFWMWIGRFSLETFLLQVIISFAFSIYEKACPNDLILK
jgi:hypothetical protein